MSDREEIERFKSLLKKLFGKNYDELALYVIGISFILLYLIDPLVHSDFSNFINNSSDLRIYLAIPILIVGLFYSIVHVFTNNQKTKFQKKLMLNFVLALNLIIGMFGLFYATRNNDISIWLPLFNFMYAAQVYNLLDISFIEFHNVTNNNAKWFETLLATVLTFYSVTICYYILGLHWIETMSISIVVGNQISGATHKLGFKLIELRS